MRRFWELVLAVQFLTIIPVSVPSRWTTRAHLRASAAWYPLVGAGLGLALWGTGWALTDLPALPRAVAMLIVYTGLTGGLHLDGLMDTVDALGSRAPREQALAIMKDSRVGALGAVAGLLSLLAKAALFSAWTRMPPASFVLVPAVARLALLWAMGWSPPPTGAGSLGAVYARAVRLWVPAGWTVVLALTAWWQGSGVAGPLVVGLGGVTAWLFVRAMVRRFGAMTGDTYGALNELVEVLGWYVALG